MDPDATGATESDVSSESDTQTLSETVPIADAPVTVEQRLAALEVNVALLIDLACPVCRIRAISRMHPELIPDMHSHDEPPVAESD